MQENLQIISGIAVLLIFIACGGIAVLDMIGKVEIRKEYQRKTLFSVLIVEAIAIPIGAAQGFFNPAVAVISGDDKQISPDNNMPTPFSSSGGASSPIKSPTNKSEVEPELKTAVPEINGSALKEPEGPDTPIIEADPTPSFVQTTVNNDNRFVLNWAHGDDNKSGALGMKPLSVAAMTNDYPACVDVVLSRETPFPNYLTSAANNCRIILYEFRTNYIDAHYSVKKPYDEKLETWDEKLRENLDDESIAKRRYIKREKTRLNDIENGELNAFLALDTRSQEEADRCFSNNCQK